MFPQGRTLLCLLLALSGALLSSCQGQSGDMATPNASASRADMAPMVRPLPLVPMASPMIVEFTLPPPGRSGSSHLFLGIRVRGNDKLDALDAVNEMRRMGLSAELKLERVDGRQSMPVPLVRLDALAGDDASLVPIGPDGHVPGGWLDDVDYHSLQLAGLYPADGDYAQLALARAQAPQPGKYRLSIRLPRPDPQLGSNEAELLVAYGHRSK